MENIAVIDLGSNSVRMMVNSVEADGKWKNLLRVRETVRLGEGMKDGCLNPESMERVIDALANFHKLALGVQCSKIIATATEAVRIAKNKDEFLNAVKEKAGLSMQILSGAQEAYYSFLAVSETLPIDNALIFDTGGGSTELMLVKNHELVKSVSTPCGAVMMTEKYKGQPQESLYNEVRGILLEVSWLEDARGLPLYGVGGSARTLALLCKKQFANTEAMNGFEISRNTAMGIYQTICSTPADKRSDIEGMDKSRADIILAGLTPLKAMMDLLDSPKLIVCTYGVKDGVFFEKRNEIIRHKSGLNIVLVEPEIPQNTGNIARTCAATGARLHLVKPLGFEISDKALKRAGLDYWSLVDVKYYENIGEFFEKNAGGRYFFATTKAEKTYAQVSYRDGDYIIFGKETKGLDEDLLKENLNSCIRIPMVDGARSLNLGNSVAVIVYEALRQNDFMYLKQKSNYLTEE